MASISLEHLCKQYGAVQVLRDVSFEIHEGEFMVVVGPSGCGKSTLVRTIAGFEAPSSGEIRFDRVPVNDTPASQRGVAMVFQNYALYPHMTGRDNLAFGLRNLGTPEPEVRKRVEDVAETLHIQTLLDRRPDQMSGGERQRVAIGRAIIRNPGVFLFDEPLSSLDASLRVEMRVELARLHQRFPVTTVYVTHDQIEAMTLADRIAVLNKGRLEQIGPPLMLYHRPNNLFVAGFLGSPPMNFLPATVVTATSAHSEVRLQAGGCLRSGADSRALPPHAPVTVGIRPQHVTFRRAPEGLPVRVNVVERLGDRRVIYATLTSQSSPIDCVAEEGEGPGALSVAPHDVLKMRADPQAVHLFNEHGDALPMFGSPQRHGESS